MSKQVEDNKEMQQDLKEREAELKREMEEKRQVRCAIVSWLMPLEHTFRVWCPNSMLVSICWRQHNINCITAIFGGAFASEPDQNLISCAMAVVSQNENQLCLSELHARQQQISVSCSGLETISQFAHLCVYVCAVFSGKEATY